MRYLLFTLISFLFFSCDKGLTVEQQLQADIEKIESYLADHNLTAESTASGLHYIITNQGSGGHPSLSSTVTVNYVGKLLDTEKVFDQTTGIPVTYPLVKLIQGWQEGIPFLQKGGKGTFFIPSALGYGPSGAGSDIPANAPLIFEIELVNF